jgi:hypothetical protein
MSNIMIPAFFRDPTLITPDGGRMVDGMWLFDNRNVLEYIVVMPLDVCCLPRCIQL